MNSFIYFIVKILFIFTVDYGEVPVPSPIITEEDMDHLKSLLEEEERDTLSALLSPSQCARPLDSSQSNRDNIGDPQQGPTSVQNTIYTSYALCEKETDIRDLEDILANVM